MNFVISGNTTTTLLPPKRIVFYTRIGLYLVLTLLISVSVDMWLMKWSKWTRDKELKLGG